MRPYIVIAAALAAAPAFVAAQDAQVPVCVYTCITGAAAMTSCASSDDACLCAADGFLTATVNCMEQSCDSESLAYGLAFGEQYCTAAGVPVTLTGGSSASAAATEAPSSVSEAASSAASSVVSSQSVAASSASGSAPAPSATGSDNGASALLASSALALFGAGAAALLI
ncbi:hypothetical protein JCM11251_004329 [Rhodosporidiobolus azoricus]